MSLAIDGTAASEGLAQESRELGVSLGALDGGPALPLVVRPRAGGRDQGLVDWVRREGARVRRWVREHGAVLFRGFTLGGAQGFEDVASAIEPQLGSEYLGTSPRNALTKHVYTASELPPFYPIPQHIEMSFLAHPPRVLFFAALAPNTSRGGETPLADFRAVWRDLDPEVRERFEERGVRNVRNYAGPEAGSRSDPWKLKRWDEMFGTSDRAEVERRARAEGLTPSWREGDVLRLENVQPAWRTHPETGERVWLNHAQVFHPSAAAGELRRIATRQRALRSRLLATFAGTMVAVRRRLVAEDDLPMNVTFGDGTPISDRDMERVRDAIWKNLVVYRWEQDDVVVLDNTAISHGRLPYRGKRTIAVAWA